MSKRHHPPNRRATIVDQAGIKTTNCFVRLGDSNESRRILRGQYLPNAAWRAEPEWLKIVRTGGISWLRLFSRDGSRGNLTDGQKQVSAIASHLRVADAFPDGNGKSLQKKNWRVGFQQRQQCPFLCGWVCVLLAEHMNLPNVKFFHFPRGGEVEDQRMVELIDGQQASELPQHLTVPFNYSFGQSNNR